MAHPDWVEKHTVSLSDSPSPPRGIPTDSRLAAVRYYHKIKDYLKSQGYDDMEVLVAFSGSLQDPDDGPDGPEYTEPGLNVGHDGQKVKESQTKKEFHNWGSVLVVAEKYQTGFDEPLLHTLVIDKKLKDVKAVQTICRIDRTCKGKDDTLVLDFVNTREQILDAFQPFYTETGLAEAIDTDRIYKVLDEIHGYGVYDEEDVEKAASLEFGRDRKNVQGKIKSAMVPAVKRYDLLDEEARYQFRRKVRSFIKWYSYVTQVVRMFDREMHKEYVFLGYLVHLLKSEKVTVESIDDKVRMDYYKLEQTWQGAIELEDMPGEWEYSDKPGNSSLDRKKDPLSALIAKINEEYAGNLTEEDKVIMDAPFRSADADPRVKESIAHDGDVIFQNSIWPNLFSEKAMEQYMKLPETFEALFQDKAKYDAMMKAIGEMLLLEHRRAR